MSRSLVAQKTFSSNLDRIMTYQGLKNSWLAEMLGVSRELIRQWRSGLSYPSKSNFEKLTVRLECTEQDLTMPLASINLTTLLKDNELTVNELARITKIEAPILTRIVYPSVDTDVEPILANNLNKIVEALECTKYDIIGYPERPKAMTLGEWAKREAIPFTRAKNLFQLKIIFGSIQTKFSILIPESVVAPQNSKQLVTLAKKRPNSRKYDWSNFDYNLRQRMANARISNIMMAEVVGVRSATVSHWRSGIRVPHENKLETIATLCDCSIEQLFQG